jgi:hypothetical protein
MARSSAAIAAPSHTPQPGDVVLSEARRASRGQGLDIAQSSPVDGFDPADRVNDAGIEADVASSPPAYRASRA